MEKNLKSLKGVDEPQHSLLIFQYGSLLQRGGGLRGGIGGQYYFTSFNLYAMRGGRALIA